VSKKWKTRITSACQSLYNRLRAAGNHGEINPRGAVGTATPLLPVLQGAGVERKTARKLGPTEARSSPHGSDVHIQWQWKLMHDGGLRLTRGNCGSPRMASTSSLATFFRFMVWLQNYF
jgi:hypothetical protein